MISSLTPGFHSVALEGQLSLPALSLVGETIRWTACIDNEYHERNSNDNQSFLMRFDPRANSAQAMRLCRISSRNHPVERAICKAIFVYHANMLNWTCRCSGYRRIVEELAEAVRYCNYHERWSRDLWSWLSLLTANAARRSFLQQLQVEMTAKFLALNIDLDSWESVQSLLRKFLLHSRMDREWKLCWEMKEYVGVSQN